MSAHTAGPLRVDPLCPERAISAENRIVFSTIQSSSGAARDNADMTELVRRWNAHEDLLAACELALRGLTEGLLPTDPNVLETLRAALAKAGK